MFVCPYVLLDLTIALESIAQLTSNIASSQTLLEDERYRCTFLVPLTQKSEIRHIINTESCEMWNMVIVVPSRSIVRKTAAIAVSFLLPPTQNVH